MANNSPRPSTSESSRRLDANLERALRDAGTRDDITSTASLVDAFNKESNARQRHVLRCWLQEYVKWLSSNSDRSLHEDVLLEYASLATVYPKDEDDKNLLSGLFVEICNYINRIQYGQRASLQALNNVLHSLHENALSADNSVDLVKLAKDLLDRVTPPHVFNESTYPVLSASLTAICQTTVILKSVAPNCLNTTEGSLYQAFRETLAKIANCQEYYPFLFQTRLIEQGLQRLVDIDGIDSMHVAYKRICHALSGMANAFHGMRTLITLDINPKILERMQEDLKKAMAPNLILEKSWYDIIHLLTRGRLLSLGDPKGFENFKSCYSSALEKQKAMEIREEEDRRELRFGIISQLLQLALDADHAEMQLFAAEQLIQLATVYTAEEDWALDFEILEALLVALATLHAENKHRNEVREAIHTIKSRHEYGSLKTRMHFNSPRAKKLWQKVYGKLKDPDTRSRRSNVEGKSGSRPDETLYFTVRKRLGMFATFEYGTRHIRELKEGYKQPNFVHAPHFLRGEKGRNVRDLEYCLKVCDTLFDDFYDEESGQEDQMAAHHMRRKSSRRSIPLSDIFAQQASSSDQSAKPVHRVLLFGNPGTGKTAISKKIPHEWAIGTWGVDFRAVYMVAVKDLNEKNFQAWKPQKQKMLPTAIANLRFDCESTNRMDVLIEEIGDRLNSPLTLLILDGVDEADELGRDVVEQAFQYECKLLLLSRPYNLREEQSRTDCKIELVGLDDQQLKRFIEFDLTGQSGTSDVMSESVEDLINLLKKEKSIWEIARIPVNANIICFVWKHRDGRQGNSNIDKGLLGLYQEISVYLWVRYAQDLTLHGGDRREAFRALERIAYEAVSQHKVLIPRPDVLKHAETTRLGEDLKRAGFLFLQPANTTQYRFPHLTFQEYFAAQYLAQELGHDESDHGSDTRRRAIEYVSKHKYCPMCQFTFKLMTQEITKSRGNAGLTRLMQILDKPSLDLVGVQHLFLKIRVLDDFLTAAKDWTITGTEENELVVQLLKSASTLFEASGQHHDFLKTVVAHLEQLSNVSGHLQLPLKEALCDVDRFGPRCEGESKSVLRLPSCHSEGSGSNAELAKNTNGHMMSRRMDVSKLANQSLINSLHAWLRGNNADVITSISEKLLATPVILEEKREGLSQGRFFFRSAMHSCRNMRDQITYAADQIQSLQKEIRKHLEEKMPVLYTIPDLLNHCGYPCPTSAQLTDSEVTEREGPSGCLQGVLCCCWMKKKRIRASTPTTHRPLQSTPQTSRLALRRPKKGPSKKEQSKRTNAETEASQTDRAAEEEGSSSDRGVRRQFATTSSEKNIVVKAYDSEKHQKRIFVAYDELNFVPGVCWLIDVKQDGRTTYLVFERGDCSLTEYLAAGSWASISKKNVVKQVLEVVRRIHSRDIVHGEIYPDSFMLFEKQQQLKLTDFDFMSFSDQAVHITKTKTTDYTSPEVRKAKQEGKKTITADTAMDAWSVGAIVFEVITGERYYKVKQSRDATTVSSLLKKKLATLDFSEDEAASLLQALQELLQEDPKKRCPVAEALHSVYFNDDVLSQEKESDSSTEISSSRSKLEITTLSFKESWIANLWLTSTVELIAGRRHDAHAIVLDDNAGVEAMQIADNRLPSQPVFVVPLGKSFRLRICFKTKSEVTLPVKNITAVRASTRDGASPLDLPTKEIRTADSLCEVLSFVDPSRFADTDFKHASPKQGPLNCRYMPLDVDISFVALGSAEEYTIRERLYLKLVKRKTLVNDSAEMFVEYKPVFFHHEENNVNIAHMYTIHPDIAM